MEATNTELQRLTDENARLRAQLFAALTGDPKNLDFVTVSSKTVEHLNQHLKVAQADPDNGCCRMCGAYLETMPHSDECAWADVTEEWAELHCNPTLAAEHVTPHLDCATVRDETLRAMCFNATERENAMAVWNAAWMAAVRACALLNGPDSLTAEEFVKLRGWIQNEERAPAQVAFTAGAARDAAMAFEMAVVNNPDLRFPSVHKALAVAVGCLYQNGHTGGEEGEHPLAEAASLWKVVDALSPPIARRLNETPTAAYEEVLRNLKLSEAQYPESALLDSERWRFFVRNNGCEHGWHGNPENHTLNVSLFFGTFDPRSYIKWDGHGHGRITPALIDAALRHKRMQSPR